MKCCAHGLMAVAMLVLWTAAAGAQDPSGPDREGRAYVTIGVAAQDVDALNGRLASHGYPPFDDRRLAIGFGVHGVHGHWLAGGEGQRLIGQSVDASHAGRELKTSLNGAYGFFNVGYLLLKSRDLHVYPVAGIGGGAVQLRLSDRSSPSFDEVLAGPGRSARLTTGSLLFQIAGGADRLFVLRTREVGGRRHAGGIVVGVRAGYVFSPWQSNWRLDTTRIDDGPAVSFSGPYVRALIGIGSKRLR